MEEKLVPIAGSFDEWLHNPNAADRAFRERCAAEIVSLRAIVAAARALVDQQANDQRLWKPPLSYPHDDVQRALRRLHEVVEGKTAEECARAALAC